MVELTTAETKGDGNSSEGRVQEVVGQRGVWTLSIHLPVMRPFVSEGLFSRHWTDSSTCGISALMYYHARRFRWEWRHYCAEG